MNIADLIKKWVMPTEVTIPKDYVIKPYCPCESVEYMIRSCTILHKDCPHQSNYKSCKYYKERKKHDK